MPAKVFAALGIDHRVRPSEPQVARCPFCGGSLRFPIGTFGVQLEQCENRDCAGHHPHHPIPDGRR